MTMQYTSSIAASGTMDSMKRCVCHHAHAYNAPINGYAPPRMGHIL